VVYKRDVGGFDPWLLARSANLSRSPPLRTPVIQKESEPMSYDWSLRQPAAAFAIYVIALAGVAACARVSTSSPNSTNPDAGSGGGKDALGTAFTDAPMLIEGGSCVVSVVCTPQNGRYCDTIGDGSGGTMNCGACPATKICESNICVSGADCTPTACQTAAGKLCGTVGDGCGRAIDCGTCDAGQVCSKSGLCVSSTCVPSTCNAGTSRYCGTIGDGCGESLDCGTCAAPNTCGGGGIPNVCGDPNCQKLSCLPAGGGQYCGTIGDGCGGTQNCAAPCPGGMACGTGPLAGLCPGSTSNMCTGLACMVPTCTGAATTTLSGTVYDPAGKIPLYNAIVYVPNTPLDPIPEGVSCDKCSAQLSGRPIATAITDASGHFVLSGVPAGTGIPAGNGIPMVIQVGKWRRQVSIPSVTACVDNPITDVNLTRLPRTQAEGHIPKIAVTTGGADALECLLRRVGVADSEITADTGNGRVHLYAGGDGTNSFATGGAFTAATTLWSNPTKLSTYDMVLFSCEGSTSKFIAQKPQASIDNVANYANGGGRLFMSHLHFYWLQKRMPDFSSTAAYIGNLTAPPPGVILTVNQTFPKGMALAQWLNGPGVNASPTLGQITVNGPEHTVTSVNPPTTEWIYLPSNPSDTPQMRRSVQYLSFNTPVGAPEATQCGRAVFTDIHIKTSVGATGGDDSSPAKPFPTGCKTNESSPQGKALEFLFFDLSACVLPPGATPTPPPPGLSSTPPPVTPAPPPTPPPPPPPPPPPIK
jgi:hypothetical protein